MSSARERLIEALERLTENEEELRDLDSLIGDGDLGFTVAAGARAVVGVLKAAPADAPLDGLLKDSAKAFGTANPSTFAALTQSSLMRASRAVTSATADGEEAPSGARLVSLLVDSAVEAVAVRGKAAVGDKTVLDPLAATAPIASAAPVADAALYTSMADASRKATSEMATKQSQKGRAAWLQERSVGLTDPGSLAYSRLLEHLADAWTRGEA